MGQSSTEADADAAVAAPLTGDRGERRGGRDDAMPERSGALVPSSGRTAAVIRRLGGGPDAVWSVAAATVLVLAAVSVLVVDASVPALLATVAALCWAGARVVLGRRPQHRGVGVDLAPFIAAADAVALVALLATSPSALLVLVPLMAAVIVVAGSFGGRGAGAAAAVLGSAGALLGFVADPATAWPYAAGVVVAATFALLAATVAATEAPSERRRHEATLRAQSVRAVRDLFDPTRIRGDLDQLLDASGVAAEAAVPADAHVLILRNGGDLVVERAWGAGPEGSRLAEGFCAAARTRPGVLEDATAGGALVVDDTELLGGRLRELIRSSGAGAVCAVPVRHAGVSYGVLVALRRGGAAFVRADADAAAACGEAVGVALAAAHVLAAHRSELARLRRLDRVRSSFLSAVSTELRDPVTVVAGFARTLVDADHRFRRADRLRYLEIIERHGLDMARLIGDLVVVQDAVSGSSSAPPRFVRTRLSALRDDIAAALGPTSAPVTCETDATVVVDAARIVQAVCDLVAAVAAVTAGPVDARIEAHDSWVRFLVTGTGMRSIDLDLARALDRIASGDAETAWSGTVTLAMAAAHVVVSDHGTRLGASDGDGGRYLWFDLWLAGAHAALSGGAGAGDAVVVFNDAVELDLAAAESGAPGVAPLIGVAGGPSEGEDVAPLPSRPASATPAGDLPYS